MKCTIAASVVAASLLALGACSQRTPSGAPPSNSPEPSNNTGAARVDPEEPKAGTNTNRPDSIKDVKPGSDSGANPAPTQ